MLIAEDDKMDLDRKTDTIISLKKSLIINFANEILREAISIELYPKCVEKFLKDLSCADFHKVRLL